MFTLIFITIGCIFALGLLIMTPAILPNFLKLKMQKSPTQKPKIISITKEEKIKWQKLVQKCSKDPIIDDESLPPLFDKTDPVMEFNFDFDLKK